MALKFFTGGSSHSSGSGVKYFDIRLNNDYIIFRGGEDEASSASLSGTLVLCLTEPMPITHVTLTLSGIVHMSYHQISTASLAGRKKAYKEKTFFEKTWTFRGPSKTKSDILQPDNYEWPFETVLEGSLPESVEGMKDAWVIYRFKGEIGRKRGKDIVVRKPLRIVRTLDPSALELVHAMSVENVWPNKIEYSISIPSKAVILGSFIQVDFKLVPLLKGLEIGSILTQVKEEQEYQLDPEWGVSGLLNGGRAKSERIVAYEDHKLDPEKDQRILDEAAEGFEFTRYIELPKSLNGCLQDCSVKGVKIRHKVKFNIQLHNPDGHVSELRANLPISIYISPILPLNEDNDLVDQRPQAGRAELENYQATAAPPVYGQHQLDSLYSDMDQSGYHTPYPGMSTPGTPYLHSRNASSENLAAMHGATTSHPGSLGTTPNTSHAIALQHRLQNLEIGPSSFDDHHGHPDSRRGSEQDGAEDYFSGSPRPYQHIGSPPAPGHSGSHSRRASTHPSANVSRRPSDEDIHHSGHESGHHSGVHSPTVFQYDHMEDLAKVPSYATAVRTPAPRSNTTEILPTYGAATTPPLVVPTPPPSAHTYMRRSVSEEHTSISGAAHLRANAPQPLNRNLSSLQDEERRFRLAQQRGR